MTASLSFLTFSMTSKGYTSAINRGLLLSATPSIRGFSSAISSGISANSHSVLFQKPARRSTRLLAASFSSYSNKIQRYNYGSNYYYSSNKVNSKNRLFFSSMGLFAALGAAYSMHSNEAGDNAASCHAGFLVAYLV
jgi:hypothetical protein